MKITRLYTGSDSQSHFSDIELPLVGTPNASRHSETIKATGIIFRETGKEYNIDWHTVPRRQFVITLAGKGEIEIGDGTKRQFGPGDIMLAEDTTGRGHISRAVGKRPRISIFVTLE
ncbi:MAG: hypothetical protein V1932_01225 [Chloroflexota bacterium]